MWPMDDMLDALTHWGPTPRRCIVCDAVHSTCTSPDYHGLTPAAPTTADTPTPPTAETFTTAATYRRKKPGPVPGR
jgi:hypothetical protein